MLSFDRRMSSSSAASQLSRTAGTALCSLHFSLVERGHKPLCCKVQIVVLLVVIFIVVVVFGVPNSLLLWSFMTALSCCNGWESRQSHDG
jgi:hypothetical protein